MKNKKKLLSVLLVFVMTVSVFHGYAAKAADTVKVTLRLEQDNKTLVTPVEVTLTDEDKKDYGLPRFMHWLSILLRKKVPQQKQ